MKRFLSGASRAGGPAGLGSMWRWLIVGALTFGIVPVSVQAQTQTQPEAQDQTQDQTQGTTAPIAAATLFGLPAENGRLTWPLALRILPPADQTKSLREQLELALYYVATQAAEGKANRVFIDFGLQAVRELRQLLKPRELIMPPVSYADAMRFLDRAERGLTRIRRIETSSDGAYP